MMTPVQTAGVGSPTAPIGRWSENRWSFIAIGLQAVVLVAGAAVLVGAGTLVVQSLREVPIPWVNHELQGFMAHAEDELAEVSGITQVIQQPFIPAAHSQASSEPAPVPIKRGLFGGMIAPTSVAVTPPAAAMPPMPPVHLETADGEVPSWARSRHPTADTMANFCGDPNHSDDQKLRKCLWCSGPTILQRYPDMVGIGSLYAYHLLWGPLRVSMGRLGRLISLDFTATVGPPPPASPVGGVLSPTSTSAQLPPTSRGREPVTSMEY